ncbi:VWA domain-containing protein [Hamadaea sp. NPDC050747]|uniref:VWA domain-containing protein n=1 Tax=Hamadaea sp. NPDC050747 TaxID=3155789 RepID=UPI0033E24BA9
MRTRLFGLIAAASCVAVLASPASAADATIVISSVAQDAGIVEFYLSGQGLPTGNAIDAENLKVTMDGTALQATVTPVKAGEGKPTNTRAVVLVLDTSGSMRGEPLTAAKAAAAAFLSALPSDVQVGVVTAGAPATVKLRLTGDRTQAKNAVAGLNAAGETALYDGISSAAELLKSGNYRERRMLVLSDGADTASTHTLPKSTEDLKGIPVDTVAFKTEEQTKGVLSGLSAGTGGRFFAAVDAASLTGAFSQAAGSFSAQSLVKVAIPRELAGKSVTMTVAVRLGTTSVSTDLALTLLPDTGGTPLQGSAMPGWPLPVRLGMLAAVFLGLLALGLLILSPLFGAAERRRRLAQVNQFAAPVRRTNTHQSESDNAVAQAALALSEQVMKQAKVEGRIAMQLDRAGMRLRPHEWLLIRALICIALGLVLAVLLDPILGLILGILLGAVGTALYHRIRASRRIDAFATQLPDALQLVIGSMRSGFSLPQSLDAMVREFPDPISSEFGRALGETRLGVDVEDALNRVAARMNSKDLSWAVVAIRVQREVGGNLAEVLQTTVATMRERSMIKRQVKSLSAEGRLSAYILLGLPIFVAAFMLVARAEYMAPLFTTPMGVMLSVIAVLEMVVGAFWLIRLVKVEV